MDIVKRDKNQKIGICFLNHCSLLANIFLYTNANSGGGSGTSPWEDQGDIMKASKQHLELMLTKVFTFPRNHRFYKVSQAPT